MIRCAVVGATGLVGNMFLKVLEEKKLNIDEYVLFASSKSKGKKIKFMNKEYEIQELTEDSFKNNKFDYALFSAGGNTSLKYSPIAAKSGCTVIDNSSAFRMKEDVPLVVPEVNISDAYINTGIIANPNCSTIQAVIPLNILNKYYKIKRVVYTTFQAVSGAGVKGIEDLKNTQKGLRESKFPYAIYNNCIPQIDVFLENNYTKEEMKMIEETRKILHIPDLSVTATCVRVPVENSHSESINVEFENEFEIDELREKIVKQEGIILLDDIKNEKYPLATIASGKDDVFVGRIRRDYSVKSGINFWCVADNIRKGAATNAVQILENLLKKRLGN